MMTALVRARTIREPIPDLLRGQDLSLDDAYAMQAQANEALQLHLGPTIGFKIAGATASLHHLMSGLSRPATGRVFASTVHASGTHLDFADFMRPPVEAEIAVRLRHPLDALSRLANHMSVRGEPMEAGQLLSLGKLARTLWPDGPTHVRVEIDGLAPVEVTCAARARSLAHKSNGPRSMA